jgi:phosphopantetheinyl transferase
LSFSHEEGRLWAAMGSHGCVGIDVAYPEEFTGGYPFKRAFRPEELNCDRAFGHKNTARAAALIWSLKEAAVKAAGTGFNCYDPLEVRVTNPRIGGQGILFDVWAGGSVSAWARAEGRGWLAVALAQRASGHCAAGSFWLQNIAKRL